MEQVSTSKNLAKNKMHATALAEIEYLQKLMKKNYVDCVPVSNQALSKIANIDEAELLKRITNNFAVTREVMEEINIDDFRDEKFREIQYAKRALNKFGMRVEDDFWSTVQSGDLIEIYGADMIQKYRSTNFYEFSGYSLLDLIINEWYVLWERPTSSVNEMMKACEELFNRKNNLLKLSIERHCVKEIYNAGLTEPFIPRCIAVDFKYMAPTYKSVGKEINGLIVTCAVKPLADGEEARSIDFI